MPNVGILLKQFYECVHLRIANVLSEFLIANFLDFFEKSNSEYSEQDIEK